jgi:hypothetical protein
MVSTGDAPKAPGDFFDKGVDVGAHNRHPDRCP